MFKGTDKIKPGDIDRVTQRNGGANNAYTTEDYTIYHFDFAADRWRVALQIEADRMRNLRIDAKHEFEQERAPSLRANCNEDDPGTWNKRRSCRCFGESPYGHPVIGENKHVQGATAEIISRITTSGITRTTRPGHRRRLRRKGGVDGIKKLFRPIPRRTRRRASRSRRCWERPSTVRKKMPSCASKCLVR